MTIHDLERDQDAPGEALRSRAANLLAQRYGAANVESRKLGKKTDVFFEYDDHGRNRRLYVEAKDYSKPLSRNEVVHIWADYSGIVERTKPAELLIVTRNGLTPDAELYVNTEQAELRHRTIWQLENDVLQIIPYVRTLVGIFKENHLNEYYVEARAHRERDKAEFEPFVDHVRTWIDSDDTKPIAILAGYGAGKSSFARRIIAYQAERAMSDPHARRPVLIKLGEMVHGHSLKSVLGGIFTADPPITGYSFQTFMQLNSAGRFVIVLDGFDEMKHAMSWADFRAIVKELNTLVNEKSKVILIGRPSAFTSDVEHNLVIRGLRYDDGDWRREINWPEYEEYHLAGFSRKDRRYFIPRYLAVVERQNAQIERRPPDLEWAATRAGEVESLALRDTSILARPLHSRVLVEVAADPKTDLQQFRPGVSSWKLYSAFYKRLADRETEKDARKQISTESRLAFLREVAYWLWTIKNGAVNFRAQELPAEILNALPDGEASDRESKLREYLSGAFLERKTGNVFFFPHRSFAEFLVAWRMILNQPTSAKQHELYSSILKDGVQLFIKEAPTVAGIDNWIGNLGETRRLSAEYLEFLAGHWTPASGIKDSPDALFWEPALVGLARKPDELRNWSQLLGFFRLDDTRTLAMAMHVFMRHYLVSLVQRDPRGAALAAVDLLAAMVIKLIPDIKDPKPAKPPNPEIIKLIRACMSGGVTPALNAADERVFQIRLLEMDKTVAELLDHYRIEIYPPLGGAAIHQLKRVINISLEAVIQKIPIGERKDAMKVIGGPKLKTGPASRD